MTIAPSVEDENKVQYIGKASHITAASEGGPRYDKNISDDERKAIANAIFLCSICADMIDKNNGIDYSVDILRKWKKDHENWVLDNLNKSVTGRQTVNINTSSKNQSGGITAGVVNVKELNLGSLDDKKEHDKRIFVEAGKIFNEDNLNVITQSILGDESIWSTNIDKIVHFNDFLKKSSNEYLNKEIEKEKIELVCSFDDLLNFMLHDFDMYPRDQPMTNGYKICMRPALNIDRNGTGASEEYELHNNFYRRLRDIVLKLEENFKNYRKTIKTNLHV